MPQTAARSVLPDALLCESHHISGSSDGLDQSS
jgi:hypothetical protein